MQCTQSYMYACTPCIDMSTYNNIHAHTLTHVSTHSHMHAHTSCICTHTHSHTCMYTESHTQPHLHAHNHIYIYSHNTHTQTQTQVTHTSCMHNHKHGYTHAHRMSWVWGTLVSTPRGPWDSGVFEGKGSLRLADHQALQPRLRAKVPPRTPPSSLRSTDSSREKEVLQGSSQGWKWISRFPHALCFQSLLMQRRSTYFTDPHRVASEAAAAITGKGQPGAPQRPGGPGRSWLQRQRSV